MDTMLIEQCEVVKPPVGMAAQDTGPAGAGQGQPALPPGLHYRCGEGQGPLSRLLREDGLDVVFQPIVHLRDGKLHGHEALVRGPRRMPLHTPDALLAAARKEDLLLDFELACVVVALRRWAALRQPGRLFLNISAAGLTAAMQPSQGPSLAQWVRALGLLPRMLVLEITEHEHVSDKPALAEVVRSLHAEGMALALDDFGDGRSSLRLWAEIKPDVVKIDKYFTREISAHADKLQTLRALMQIAEIFGTTLVAEGIEDADDLRVLRGLGIVLGQGYFLGLPQPDPAEAVLPGAAAVFDDQRVAVMPELRAAPSVGRLREIAVVPVDPISPTTDHDTLADLFQLHPQWHAVAIVDQGTPIGLIDRQQFMDRYAQRYFKELHGRKPCLAFANRAPRLIERNTRIEELVGILTSQDQRYLTEGFILTDNGRYLGMGTGEQLVRTVTEARIEAARHANPLTFLPGNIPLSQHIERLLAGGGDFVACYADLNHFKPFNDHYGYWRGDEMIRLVARLAVAQADARCDFVGHVGGDDFVLLFQSADWAARCEQLVAEFNQLAQDLYDEPGRAAGGIHAEDRQGVERFFPFTTLSIGAVQASGRLFRSAEQVATVAALAKHEAKQSGSGLWLHRLPGAADPDCQCD